jgi:hypothetical protein|tara:strand:+ start:252 stop:449 length:198 start_codon:yes stop_codon:yes gene_type:complete
MLRYLDLRIFNSSMKKSVMKKVIENISKSSNTKKIVNVNIQNKDDIKYYNQNYNFKSKVYWNKEW